MSPIKLKRILASLGQTQAQLAVAVQFSQATVAQLLNHGIWPRTSKGLMRDKTVAFLKQHGANDDQIAVAFERAPAQLSLAEASGQEPKEDEYMSLRKKVLHPKAMQHFRLMRNPFDEVASAEEFYVNEQLRYTRAQLLDACKRGGFVALVGESGSGKSTLRRDLQERIQREDMPIQVIQPFVVGMESNDEKGKSLKAMHVLEAIMATIAPHEPLRASADARYRQLLRALTESYRAGVRHVVLIEEAHSLPKTTLRHFKRFLELEDGFKRLLSVILIGQTELAEKLDPRDPSVREVVQRCELVTLPPLDEHLEDYLRFRFKLLDVDVSKVITTDGLQAIRERLCPPVARGQKEQSYLYPLAVHNLVTSALNLAFENGAPAVSADIVKDAPWN